MNYTQNLYKIMESIKMKAKVDVIPLLNSWKKKNESFFINMNVKIKLNFFSHNKLFFDLEPKS